MALKKEKLFLMVSYALWLASFFTGPLFWYFFAASSALVALSTLTLYFKVKAVIHEKRVEVLLEEIRARREPRRRASRGGGASG